MSDVSNCKEGLVDLTDCMSLFKDIPDNSIDLIITSPPYSMIYLKSYYTFFKNFMDEVNRVLRPKGEVFLNFRSGKYKSQPVDIPDKVIEALIKTKSEKGYIVLDPFARTGTNLVIAKKLKRKYLGSEINPTNYANIIKRLEAVK